jgi:hypothetical protein
MKQALPCPHRFAARARATSRSRTPRHRLLPQNGFATGKIPERVAASISAETQRSAEAQPGVAAACAARPA